jgi:FAD/FMN-containing dehydrogenase/Fe-S oxidoreductase
MSTWRLSQRNWRRILSGDLQAVKASDAISTILDELALALEGDLRRDRTYRRIYATDASVYAKEPVAVAFPRSQSDIEQLLTFSRTTGVPLLARGAGTSLAGQVVGDGLIVDFGRYMNAILEIDAEGCCARVQPGVIQDELNRVAGEHGLLLGPDTSTGNRAMLGGMIGNNSCGSRSILYGTTRDHVRSLEVILADGSHHRLTDWSAHEVEAVIAGDGPLSTIVAGLRKIVAGNEPLIRERFPAENVRRRNSGYALDYLTQTVLVDPAGQPLNLGRFLCGSEGTLALVIEATVNLEPVPAARGLVVAHFDSLAKALAAVQTSLSFQPSAVELIDRPLLELTKGQIEQRRNRFFIDGDPDAVLLVEVFGESEDQIDDRLGGLSDRLESEGGAYSCVRIANDRMSRVWALRKAALGLLMGLPGDAKPVAFVEDTAVAVERLPAFIERFQGVMAKHQTECVYYGHASVGELHMRPILDLKRSDHVERLAAIGGDIADLVAEFRGSLSGEHGDGRVRSPFIGRVMGDEIVELFRRVKTLFDPAGLLNPGKIVDPLPVDADLRYPPERVPSEVSTVFHFEEGGLTRAVEKCNGAGVCRKLATAGGTMCPSYMVTQDELHSTRGRANLFRSLLWERDPEAVMASSSLYEALDLCLQCKGCMSECPASVDMAKLKSEFLQHHWDVHGLPLRVRAIGHIALLNRLALVFPRLSNAVLRVGPIARVLRAFLGFHPSRQIPAFATTRLRRWFRKRAATRQGETVGQVALFLDEFTDAHDPAIGRAAVELLEGLGYEVLLPKHVDSGRPLISKGLLRAASKRARRNVEILAPLADAGIPILGLEPSAALTLVDEYPALVPEAQRADARKLAGAVRLIGDFIAEVHSLRDLSGYFDAEHRKILLHGHCHQKALVGIDGCVAALSIPTGHEVAVTDAGCCGMAGSFGYDRDHHDISMAIAEQRLFPAIRSAPEGTVVVAPGFSCRHQISDGLGVKALHPVQVLRSALQAR